ncbi:MAG: enoyl-CoA hydratase/isomerase family protein [Acidimicrobiales bacterium]|nr:enoyl-CoA hydratase/isomerase family protein [Acidimicrobiales bacterium]RZV42676.1 MAG: enoyl-CoA hydratase/isomerase family protein [Acidimicrobiales bacterium]
MSNIPPFSGFRVDVSGARADLVLNQPEKLNPLSTQTLLDIEHAARWIDTQRDVRVVVVRGEGRAFCAGADLDSFTAENFEEYTPQIAGDAGRRMADAVEAMRAVAIAQIHGHCVGGGLVLAAACDLRVAADGTRFAIPEVDLGIPLAWGGIPRLVREIGPARTKELVMTCRPFFPEEGLASGFLNRVVDSDQLAASVDDLAAQVASKPRIAIEATKTATNAVTADMVGVSRAWSDTNSLQAALHDDEAKTSRENYVRSVLGGG